DTSRFGQRQHRRLDHGRRRADRLLRRPGVLVVVGAALHAALVRRPGARLRAWLRRLALGLSAPARDRGGRGRRPGRAGLLDASTDARAGIGRYGPPVARSWTYGGVGSRGVGLRKDPWVLQRHGRTSSGWAR